MRIDKSEGGEDAFPLTREDLIEGDTYLPDYYDLSDVDHGLAMFIGTKRSGKNDVYQLINLREGELIIADKDARFRSVEAHITIDNV